MIDSVLRYSSKLVYVREYGEDGTYDFVIDRYKDICEDMVVLETGDMIPHYIIYGFFDRDHRFINYSPFDGNKIKDKLKTKGKL